MALHCENLHGRLRSAPARTGATGRDGHPIRLPAAPLGRRPGPGPSRAGPSTPGIQARRREVATDGERPAPAVAGGSSAHPGPPRWPSVPSPWPRVTAGSTWMSVDGGPGAGRDRSRCQIRDRLRPGGGSAPGGGRATRDGGPRAVARGAAVGGRLPWSHRGWRGAVTIEVTERSGPAGPAGRRPLGGGGPHRSSAGDRRRPPGRVCWPSGASLASGVPGQPGPEGALVAAAVPCERTVGRGPAGAIGRTGDGRWAAARWNWAAGGRANLGDDRDRRRRQDGGPGRRCMAQVDLACVDVIDQSAVQGRRPPRVRLVEGARPTIARIAADRSGRGRTIGGGGGQC